MGNIDKTIGKIRLSMPIVLILGFLYGLYVAFPPPPPEECSVFGMPGNSCIGTLLVKRQGETIEI